MSGNLHGDICWRGAGDWCILHAAQEAHGCTRTAAPHLHPLKDELSLLVLLALVVGLDLQRHRSRGIMRLFLVRVFDAGVQGRTSVAAHLWLKHEIKPEAWCCMSVARTEPCYFCQWIGCTATDKKRCTLHAPAARLRALHAVGRCRCVINSSSSCDPSAEQMITRASSCPSALHASKGS
jgi:hypothetical protein